MALKCPAFQSSETDPKSIIVDPVPIPDATPSPAAARAVDGNRDSAQPSTCTITESESGPWWMVDLQKEYKIDAVAIASSDSNQATLDGVEIRLGISKQLNDSRSIR